MKYKYILKSVSAFLLMGSLLGMAQTGKVGINTDMPTETFHVNGTARVQDLPQDGVGKIYKGGEAKGTTFNATRIVVADNDGNLGYREGMGGVGVYAKIRKMGTDTVVRPDDYTVIAKGGTLALPNPAQNKDRILVVCVEGVHNGPQVNVIVSSMGGANIILPTLYPNQQTVTLTNGGTTGGVATGCTQFHSDGKNWYGVINYTR